MTTQGRDEAVLGAESVRHAARRTSGPLASGGLGDSARYEAARLAWYRLTAFSSATSSTAPGAGSDCHTHGSI